MSRRRRVLLLGGGLLLVVLALPLIMASRSTPPPPLDPGMQIRMSDGSTSTLEEVVARAKGPAGELPPAPEDGGRIGRAPGPDDPDPATAARQGVLPLLHADDLTYEEFLRLYDENENPYDLFRMAEWAQMQGRVGEAVALLRSLPQDHPRYARAMRMLGWDLYTRQLDDPGQGIWFVNKSLAEKPFEGNAWQDAYRVYWASVFN